MKHKTNKKGIFERFANWMTHFTGSSAAFIGAVAIVLIWALSGPIFDYSETWQLVINTGTTIITFLMVFLIQKSQNKDSKAIHLKLNELIAALECASNRMVDVEDLNEAELDQLHKFYSQLAQLAKKETDIHLSHSIDGARELHKVHHKELVQVRKINTSGGGRSKMPISSRSASSATGGGRSNNRRPSNSGNASNAATSVRSEGSTTGTPSASSAPSGAASTGTPGTGARKPRRRPGNSSAKKPGEGAP